MEFTNAQIRGMAGDYGELSQEEIASQVSAHIETRAAQVDVALAAFREQNGITVELKSRKAVKVRIKK